MLLKRVLIGLLTLGAAVGVFWFYSQHQRTPDISRRTLADPNDALKDAVNVGGQGGELSGVKVYDNTYQFDFEDRDDDYRVYQQWGFKDISHRGPGVWQVVKPYMTRFEDEVTCFVTANRGVFRIEEINNKPYPREFTFSGEVHVHVLPRPGSGIEEIFIDLDEIVFQSNKSQFSSSGQILVRSPSIQLSGQGVDFIYNADEKSIQYFRMVTLEYLRIRTPREGGLFSFDKQEETPAETAGPDANEVVAEVQDANEPADPLGPIYMCLLQDNVVIRTPKQKIHSLNHITLTDILWPKTAFGRQDANQLDPNATVIDVADANAMAVLEPNSVRAMASLPEDPNSILPEEDMLDIIVTCDQGILISPADSNWTPESEGLAKPEVARVVDVNMPTFAKDPEDNGLFLAQDIEYNVQTKNAQAQGPVELTFYAPEPNEPNSQGRLIPINVKAQKFGRFDANDNSIVFTGECECILQKHDANDVIEEYRLEAPKICIELVDEKDAQAIAARQDLKHIEAVGGGVTLGIFTRVKDANVVPPAFAPATGELLAGAEMTCDSFECDPNRKGHEIFTATGPGTIFLNNAKAVLGGSSNKKKEPYYASLRGFETMKYYVADNLIVADAQDPNFLMFSYFPVGDDPNMEGQANHVEIHLVKTEAGRTEMGTLTATGNVSVTHGPNQFTGGLLSYSHDTMRLIIQPGEAGQRCMVNGTAYPGIDYNLTTGELKTSLSNNLSVLPLN
jgi:hypothetical protein